MLLPKQCFTIHSPESSVLPPRTSDAEMDGVHFLAIAQLNSCI